MSAIAGLVYLDGRSDREGVLGRMLDRMAHRGPHGRGESSVGPASFGHLLLHTTEESIWEKLPMRCGNLLLTCATRLDNRDELLNKLQSPPRSPDSTLILEAFQKWPGQFPEHLDGDFAIAWWNDAEQSLHCARDHFGVKPFYYYYAPNRFFIFASQIRALFAHPGVPRRLNKTRLAQYWLGRLPDQTITFYDGIERLPAGHTLAISNSNLFIRPYWMLDPHNELALNSDAEYVEGFREHFTRAVKTRLRSSFKIGFQLSGGLDSSAVACVARDLLRSENRLPAKTYSDIFPTIPSADERVYIDSVLAQEGFEPQLIDADRDSSPLSELRTFLSFDDEGNFNTNSNLVYILHRRMSQDGVRICLDGFDGDTTVGHGRFLLAELFEKKDWVAFDRELEAFCKVRRAFPQIVAPIFAGSVLTEKLRAGAWVDFLDAAREAAPHFQCSLPRLLVETAVRPLAPRFLQKGFRFISGRPSATDFLLTLIDRDFARSANLHELAREFDLTSAPRYTSERALQHHLLTSGSIAGVLERYDYLAGHFKMENRHPFMDRRLVEFCLAMPASQKLSGGFGRSILRRGLKESLPETIVRRSGKADLTDAFRYGFLSRDRHFIEDLLFNCKHLHQIGVKAALYEGFGDALSGKLPDSHVFILFRVLTSGAWLEHTDAELR